MALEQDKARDLLKKETVAWRAAIAEKFVRESISVSDQKQLVEDRHRGNGGMQIGRVSCKAIGKALFDFASSHGAMDEIQADAAYLRGCISAES